MPKILKKLKQSDKRATAFLAVIVVLAVVAIGTTLAYVITKTASIRNEFTPPEIDVTLDIAGNKVQNSGDIDIYARVAVIATWVDAEGKTLSTMPEMNITLNSGWFQGDDRFYYFRNVLEPNAESEPIESITLADGETTPDGYTLRVQVLANVIQATPKDAVESAWSGVDVNDDGTLTKAQNN